jgi:maltooligosyltrehalose trehalohydrolase
MADHWLDDLKIDYDEDERWIVMHRGSLAIVCNLNSEDVTVPVTGEPLLAWGEPTVDDDATRLDGHSFVVLRTVNS